MAQHKSAIKRIRQTQRRNRRNSHLRSTLRSSIKKLRALLSAKETEKARSAMPLTQKTIDKSISKGILHRNTGRRYKSRLSLALQQQFSLKE